MCKKKKHVYRAIMLAPTFISLFIFLDVLLAQLLIKPSDRTFRTSHPYYHHGLIPNQKAMASWFQETYPLYAKSLGFRTGSRQHHHTLALALPIQFTPVNTACPNDMTEIISIVNSKATFFIKFGFGY